MQEIILSVRFAWKSITANGLRTLLTLSGIIIGTVAVFSVLSLGDGLKRFVNGQIESFGSDIIQTEVKVPSTDKNSTANATGLAQGIQITTLTQDDGKAVAKLPNVVAWYGGSIGQELATHEDTTKRVMLFGAGWQAPVVDQGTKITEGNFYTEEEDMSAANVAVLGSGVRKTFFPDQPAVGQTIKIKDQSYRVIGVLAERGSTGFVSFDDFIYIPVTTLQKKVLGVDYVAMLMSKVADMSKAESTAEDIRMLLRDRHDITDPKNDDFAVTTIAEAKKTVETVFNAVQILLTALASISLCVSGVGILNVMFVAVAERTTEIGLRKAVGARDKDILRQFLLEAAGVALLGGLIGLILAIVLVWGAFTVVQSMGIKVGFALAWGNVVFSLGFALVAGLVFGVYPAWKASKISPLQAIRSE
ncbi:MAG: ABC transporter permease [Candidatus Moraniibacteriota bacterium]